MYVASGAAVLVGTLGHFAPKSLEKPLLFSTEVAAAFKKVEAKSKDVGPKLYEKTTHGFIDVRTNGEWLAYKVLVGHMNATLDRLQHEKAYIHRDNDRCFITDSGRKYVEENIPFHI